MNYRHLLSELIMDWRERLENEPSKEKKSVYKECISDIYLCLDMEVQEISMMNAVKEILNG